MGTFTEVRFIEVGPSPNCLSPSVVAFTTSIMQCVLCLLVVVAVMAQLAQGLYIGGYVPPVIGVPAVMPYYGIGYGYGLGGLGAWGMPFYGHGLDSEDTGGRQMLTPPTSGAFQILSNVSGHP